jgi:hypothetical protein
MDRPYALLRFSIVQDEARWAKRFHELQNIERQLVGSSMERLVRSKELLARVQVQVDRSKAASRESGSHP